MKEEVLDLVNELTFAEDDDSIYGGYSEEYRKRRFLGMTSGQRFVLSMLLFVNFLVVGCLVLLLTERIWLF